MCQWLINSNNTNLVLFICIQSKLQKLYKMENLVETLYLNRRINNKVVDKIKNIFLYKI